MKHMKQIIFIFRDGKHNSYMYIRLTGTQKSEEKKELNQRNNLSLTVSE